ncbi:Retrovirus-related Gag polyprotein from transposon HMS-Beagle [Eumeta japonica]|uniref:Retrovirus-related Gag polyprotein from transposon HMS-Beagle n=1 Tax=Eumeta variegata TaxID=151549 RepID=A0A4C1T308_EUMVA|nr:Retrovirus-related Gag polyprotein from transposon HMS-Beagle [Eumeta japonica]
MANPNNLIRPPTLSANNDPPQQNSQLSLQDLRSLISSIASDVLRQQGPQVVHETLNPSVNSTDLGDQQINRHADQLHDMDKIPDVVKCLKEFSGQPGEFNSWKKSVERILSIYDPIRGTPKYYGILSVIRNKITGNADVALESYNTPLNWQAISQCLITHYGDKRDLSTLEYQMTTLVQGSSNIQEFYQQVYTHLSLILNKLGCLQMSNESLSLLSKSYRDKALDTFIRGLNGDLPRLLGMREPTDLPQALHLCLKLENQNFRANHANNAKRNQPPHLPPKRNFGNPPKQSFYPQLAYIPRTTQQRYQPPNQWNQLNTNPPRPPKPQPRPEPMEVDQSLRSQRINYMNRPQQNQFFGKRPNQFGNNQQHKNQRMFHIDTEETGNRRVDNEGRQYGEPSDIHFLA